MRNIQLLFIKLAVNCLRIFFTNFLDDFFGEFLDNFFDNFFDNSFFWLFGLSNTNTLLKSSCFFLLQCAFTSLLEKLNGLPAQPQQKTKYEQRPWLSSNLAFWMANVQRRKSFQKPAKMTKTTKVLQFKSHFSFLSVHILWTFQEC